MVCLIIGGRFYNRWYVIVTFWVYFVFGVCLEIGGMFRNRAYVSKSGGMSRK